MTSAQHTFAARLRAARERAGVRLETIAESTKIKRSFLIGLENGNLSQWPAGIFRRAFFREYLAAIGIASESLVDEFVRLFPEGGPAPEEIGTDDAGELRLTLADVPESAAARVATHLTAVIADLGLVALLVAVVALLFDVQFWAAAVVVTVAYYSAGTAYGGRTPGGLWASGARQTFGRAAPVRSSAVRTLRIVSRQAELPRKARTAEEPVEETLGPESRPGSRRRLRAASRMAR